MNQFCSPRDDVISITSRWFFGLSFFFVYLFGFWAKCVLSLATPGLLPVFSSSIPSFRPHYYTTKSWESFEETCSRQEFGDDGDFFLGFLEIERRREFYFRPF